MTHTPGITLDEAVTQFEALFEAVSDDIGHPDPGLKRTDGKDWAKCPAGVRYVTIMHSGPKEEGAAVPDGYPSPERAIAAWLESATLYARGEGPYLWWRYRPEVDEMKPGNWVVYSRLVVTRHNRSIAA